MELEFHQLDLRHEGLRRRAPERERRLLASLAEHGQQTPIVVVGDGAARVVIDGFKRVRVLKALKADVVQATTWEMAESEALLLDRQLRTAADGGALEQGWLLRELHEHFGFGQDELARRFDKSRSWVSRRLALVEELPGEIQEQVRKGVLCPHAAMKHLVPLARANREAAVRLALAIAPLKLSSRRIAALRGGWLAGDETVRERLLTAPELYLRALEETKRAEPSPWQQLQSDLEALAGIARRAQRRLEQGLWKQLGETERAEAARCFRQAQADTSRLFGRLQKEETDARPETP